MADYPPPQQPGTPPPGFGQQPPPQPGYGAPQYGGQPQYGYSGAPKANGLAIASLVCGLAGILTCGVASLAAIPLGFVAISQINKSNGTQTGKGMAIGGIVVGALVVVTGAVLWVSLVLFANEVEDACDQDTDGDGLDDCGTFLDDFTTTTFGVLPPLG
jgi:hypothetical protein